LVVDPVGLDAYTVVFTVQPPSYEIRPELLELLYSFKDIHLSLPPFPGVEDEAVDVFGLLR